MKVNSQVRIKKYDENHVNAYARVIEINFKTKKLKVTNMNMLFQGTLGREEFRFDEVE